MTGTSSSIRTQAGTAQRAEPSGSVANRARLAGGSNPHDADLDQAWFTTRRLRSGAEEIEQLDPQPPRVRADRGVR